MSKTKKSTFAPTLPSNAPGGHLDTPELDRANAFGRMAFDLEQALLDRANTTEAVKAVIDTFNPEQAHQGRELLAVIGRIESGFVPTRVLEVLAERYASDFRSVQRGYLSGLAPRHPDLTQIHAAKLAEAIKAAQANNGRAVWR
ncbi:hypothetical protein [Variovorax paradoxus]|uniref:hypothetical protein n=1 Tax=Variovorax paradoxus TaxID=34073 RepID=UPI00278A55D7|nr:hypothetical protein [Variovorax paradoxus]MDQ0591360.1 hypothetical protein [Variovorax paradoxus]